MYPDSKVHGANTGSIWGRQDPGGPYVDPKNFAIWVLADAPHFGMQYHVKLDRVITVSDCISFQMELWC